jgi:hypothetical protein
MSLLTSETVLPARMKDLSEYRNSEKERDRERDLFLSVPARGHTALDIGARDGFHSLSLAERFDSVTALDLETPVIDHPSVRCVRGNVIDMDFQDGAFDLVLCSEVLEHIPSQFLGKACREIARVAGGKILIGVPYRQDTRVGRTTCGNCGGKNPPWGHINVFDEKTLRGLFPGFRFEKVSFVGEIRERTNFLSAFLFDLAGNPWGTYDQEEGCIHCGFSIDAPPEPKPWQRIFAGIGENLRRLQSRFVSPRPIWIHVLLSKA